MESIYDLGPEEVARFMELVEGGKERVVVFFDDKRLYCTGFGSDGTYYLRGRHILNRRDWRELEVIVQVGTNDYAKIKGFGDKSLAGGEDPKSWIKRFLSGYELPPSTE